MSNIYFITGGGTGGHIYPAVAIIKELQKNGEKVYYIGNPNKPEYNLAKENNIDFLPVNVSAMPREMSLNSLFWVVKLFFAILVAIGYVKKYKPKLVFGTGGYVSAPILFAAKFLKIPYALHDADAQPGIVTRCFASDAKLLTTPFESVKNIFSNVNIEVTGNPIRKDFSLISKEDAREKLALPNKTTLLVMGGSQGARSINLSLIPVLKKLIEEFDINILHQSGKKNYEEALEMLGQYLPDYKNNPNYRLLSYIDDMPSVMKASDIVISRSGSLSLSEIKASGVASILVPYPFAAGDHQRKNAQAMVDLGCSIMVEDKNLSPENLYEKIEALLLNPNYIENMKKKALENSMPNATEIIAEKLLSL